MADSGSSLIELQEQHRVAVARVLAEVRRVIDGKSDLQVAADAFPLDDFTVLKFVLSAKKRHDRNPEKIAVEKLMETLQFRAEYRELLEKGRQSRTIKLLMPGHVGGWLGCELVLVMVGRDADMGQIIKDFGGPEETWRHAVSATETLRMVVDERSRSTGRLHKVMSIMLLDGVQEKKMANFAMLKVMGRMSKMNDTCTPQLQSRTVLVRPSPAFRALLHMAKPFLSKASVEKMVLCGSRSESDTITQCPFLKKLSPKPEEAIPDVMRGGCYPSGSSEVPQA